MRTTGFLKGIKMLVLVAVIGFTATGTQAFHKSQRITNQSVDVDITIDEQTSDSDLDEIKNMLAEHHITVEFSSVERNDLKEITGIRIKLRDDSGTETVSHTSGNQPIGEISFGRRDGQLFIDQGSTVMNMFAFFKGPNQMRFGFDQDSLFTKSPRSFMFNFDDFFDTDSLFMFGGRAADMDAMRERMKAFLKGRTGDSQFNWYFDLDEAGQQYYFRDDPNLNKLIIIDGKESTFEELNRLAENNELDSVDVLKSKTAISIYGDKAKDGAIIATTKE
ncbi:MAG: hypothetical protein KJO25_04035 [Bacteroidia bacterium]|nr:hypothetical protein [Bacteroidia bacterium]